MFFLLFSLLFSQDICKVKIDEMSIRFDGMEAPTHLRKIVYVEGEITIDDMSYTSALIEFNNVISYGGVLFNYALVSLGAEYNDLIKEKEAILVKHQSLNSHKDAEELLEKCCKHYKIYYIWQDILESFKNSSYYDINRVPHR